MVRGVTATALLELLGTSEIRARFGSFFASDGIGAADGDDLGREHRQRFRVLYAEKPRVVRSGRELFAIDGGAFVQIHKDLTVRQGRIDLLFVICYLLFVICYLLVLI